MVYPPPISTRAFRLLPLAIMLFGAATGPLASSQESLEVNVMGEDVLAKGARLKLGPFEFHPYLAVEGQGNDNVLLSRNNAEDDIAVTYVPGVTVLTPMGNHSLALKYQLTYKDYMYLDRLDGSEHRAELEAKFDFKRVYLRFQDRFASLREPLDIQFTDMVRRLANDADAAVGVRLGRWTVELAAAHRFRDYRESDLNFLDYNEYRGTLEASYEFTQRTSVFVSGTYDRTIYVDDVMNDFYWVAGSVGMRGAITNKLTWEAAVGAAYVESLEDNQKFPGEDSSDVDVYARASLSWTPIPDRMTLTVSYDRTPAPSTVSSFMTYDRFSFRFKHFFTKAFSGTLDASYEMADRSSGPDLARWSYGVGLQYRIRDWIMIYARYSYARMDAKDNGPEYQNNIGAIGFLFAF